MKWLNFLKRKKNNKEPKPDDKDAPFFDAVQELNALWEITIKKESGQNENLWN